MCSDMCVVTSGGGVCSDMWWWRCATMFLHTPDYIVHNSEGRHGDWSKPPFSRVHHIPLSVTHYMFPHSPCHCACNELPVSLVLQKLNCSRHVVTSSTGV